MQVIVKLFDSYPDSSVKALTKWMKDWAALLQFEGRWVFTEVLSDSMTENL